ncbi:MAG TPA: vitamin B12 dependent-methionine synthase activation domain-containing protein [Spirochaetota bacterium]|nr:vitamin B12 dependent-methionine synthase activation domain-containing protein [Spirochaetota bacterium]HOL57387.1 vitamin B12 dependent-methionine synthase activation domain-containing protein [Spirochaetota bacterium]HPP04921.1 vitamin B12 dependent-methionine synthase activation domain-containing protein [Spirochaetota bacterium]
MIKILKNIKIDIPFKEIYIRLGFNFHSTQINQKEKEKIDNLIKIASSYCELSAIWKIENIIIENKKVILEKAIFESEKLAKFLDNCKEVIILATTAGEKIIEYRDRLMKEEDMVNATIVDATGSEMVEAYTDYVHSLIQKEIAKKGKNLTKNRFSPGYGDLSLNCQKSIDNILNLSQINVKVLENFILYPEKSITAFIGIY